MAVVLAVTGVGIGTPAANAVTDTNPDFLLIEADLEHILKQVQISEAHAAGGDLLCSDPTDTSGKCVPDPTLPYGLRTVDGSFNNLLNPDYGSADQPFPKLLPPAWRGGEAPPPGSPPNQPGDTDPCGGEAPTCYSQKSGFVYDSDPRTISNLIVDQSVNNPAAVNAFEAALAAGQPATQENGEVFIPNTAPDEALSAPFNAWFTFFGQFFDHGLDLVNKGGNGTVVVPLQADDPLIAGDDGEFGTADDLPPQRRFLAITRATRLPGPDGEIGTADDEHNNQTTPFVDQNQTYTSSPSHQVFLREYELVDGKPRETGKLLDGTLPNGGTGGLPTWNDVKRQARDVLGINLVDTDVLNVPMLATDLYGNFDPGANGFPQLMTTNGAVEGSPGAGAISTSNAMRTDHAFLDDIANGAAPIANADPNAPPGYDNVALGEHFITGDGRGNENIGLTSVHHVFHSEHNRMVEEIRTILDKPENAELKKAFQGVDNNYDELLGEALPSGPEADDWSYEQRLFQAAKFPTEMQYQHLVFEEFARKVQPAVDAIVFNENGYDTSINPAIQAEYAHVVYRFGHSMLTPEIDRNLPGTDVQGVSLLEGFLDPRTYDNDGALTPDQAAGAVINGTTNQIGGQIDEFVIDTLRNKLLGLPLDLATINIARARDVGTPPLQVARKTFFEASGDPLLKPYTSWVDFGLSLKNGDNFGRETNFPNASLVNFVAAYGTHPTVTGVDTIVGKRAAAQLLVNGGNGAPEDRQDFMNSTGTWSVQGGTNTGLENVDFWMGGLAEALEPFGGMLGSTFNYVFERQLEDLQFGDRFYYLFRNQGNQLFSALEGNSFSGLIQRNTDASLLPADIFAVADPFIDLENLPDPMPAGLSQAPDGTWRWDGDEHIEIHGNRTTADKIRAGQGDDALWGYGGNDVIEGGSGNDSHLGKSGDDILTDSFGDDNMKGGFGNDAISAGSGDDLILGGHGDDFVSTGNDFKTVFASTGDDVVAGGDGRDTVFGGEDDDWIEGGGHGDLMQADNGNQFQNNPHGGNDVVDGGGGNDDMEGEGGDDVMIGRPNGSDRMEGMQGFDFVTYRGQTQGVDADLGFSTLQRPDAQAIRDRFDFVEGLSGGSGDDILRGLGLVGDVPDGDTTHTMTDDTIARIGGLRQLLDPGHAMDYSERFKASSVPAGGHPIGANNLLLGGSGSDILEGRLGDDFIDGDAFLNVQLQYDNRRYSNAAALRTGVFNGTINPGDIDIVREIRTAANQANVMDTAVFAYDEFQYDVTDLGGGYWQVAHLGNALVDPSADIVRNVELLQFGNGCFILGEGEMAPCGSYGVAEVVYDQTPTEDQPLGAQVVFNGIPVVNPTDVRFRWQYAADGGGAEWESSTVQNAGNCAPNGAGELTCSTSFTPSDLEVGSLLRVTVTFVDDDGVLRSIVSDSTALGDEVVNVNDVPTTPVLDSQDPMVDRVIRVGPFTDGDGTTAGFEWEWQTAATPDGPWTTVQVNPSNVSGYTPFPEDVGQYLRAVAVYTDDQGTAEQAASAATANTVVEAVAAVTAPAAPSLAAVQVMGPDSIEVSWTAPEFDGGSPITGYEVTVWNEAGQLVDVVTTGAAATSVLIDRLEDAESYSFTVAAINAIGTGDESGASELVSPGRVPTVESTDPVDGTTGVSVEKTVFVAFSERVVGYQGSNVTLTRVSDGVAVPFGRGFNTTLNRLSVNPTANLEPQTEYLVTLTGGPGAIRSATGVPLVSDSFTFTTAAAVAAPTVLGSSPEPGELGVAFGKTVLVSFSERVVGYTGSNVTLTRASDGEAVPFGRGFNTTLNRLSINPTGNLEPETEYLVTLTGGPGAIRSATGVPLVSDSFTFTTRP